jgi:hypothetical protein
MKWASVREANRRRWPFTTTGLRTRRNASDPGYSYYRRVGGDQEEMFNFEHLLC